MITVVYLPNPFKPQDRVVKPFTPEEAPTLLEAVKALRVENHDEFVFVVNGRHVKDGNDQKLEAGDFVVIAPNVRGGGGGGSKNVVGLIAGIALMVFSGGAAAGLAGIIGSTTGSLGMGMALYFGGSLLTGNQKNPKIDAPNYQGAFEGGHNWSPDNIRIQPGGAVPITYGVIRTSGQLIARRARSGYFAGKQTQYLGLLLAAGEGELDSIADIKINDTPITSIGGATFEVKLGTNNQTAVGIELLSSVIEFQGFSSEVPISAGSWVTKAQSERGERILLDFVFPSGLHGINTSTGATTMAEPWIRGQYREVGASVWTNMFPSYSDGRHPTGDNNTRLPFYFQREFTPDPARLYEFRFQNYTLEVYKEKNPTWTETPSNYTWGMNWVGLTVTAGKAQVYPGIALVAISIPATANLSGSLPKVSWLQTRSNVWVWNPAANAYQQKPANNLAWMTYDLIHQCKKLYNTQTGSYVYTVFGERKENLNYAEFAAWADFCGEVVGGYARGLGNLLLDSADQMWPTVQKIAASGRAFVIQQAGIFKPIWDAPRAMSQIFTAGNTINGTLTGGFMSSKERATAIEASFINEENDYQRDTIFVTNEDFNPAGLENPTQVFFPALTSPKLVYRLAKHMLRKNKYLLRTASFQADIDSIVSELGDVAGIQSDITAWGVGGRVMGSTTTSVVIDQDVSLQPGVVYSLLVRYPDNALVRRTIDAVTVAKTTTELKFIGAPWPTAPDRYSVYSFGLSTLETKPFMITGIQRNGDLQATLQCIEYVDGVYNDDVDFPVIDYTAANAGISSLTVKADSDTGKLGISWTIPTDKDYSGAVVYVNGKPQGFFTTETDNVEIDAPPGGYVVRVVPIDGTGKSGTGVDDEVTLGNPVLSAVSAVTLASTVKQQADGTSLIYITGTFTIPALATSVLVEVGEGSSPAVWTTLQDSRVSALQYGPVLPGTLYAIRLTAKNRYTTATPTAASITTTGDTTAPGAPTISASGYLKVIKVEIKLSSPASDLAGFEVWKNTISDINTAVLAGFISATQGEASFIDQSPSYDSQMVYWAKSVDTWGNKSPASPPSLPTHVSQILTGDITVNQIIGKDFRTALDVGAAADGVKFTKDGIELWKGGKLKVCIPITGDPTFDGIITAIAGFIGGWEIFPGYLQSGNLRLDSSGSLQTVDFVSGHSGWKQDKHGDAEFNNIRARGAVKTVVFEKDEISVVGGRTLIRPAELIAGYDYDGFLQSAGTASLTACWNLLNTILNRADTYPSPVFTNYDEYKALEQGFYREIATALGYATFGAGISEEDYDATAVQTYFETCWNMLTDIIDSSITSPLFSTASYAAFLALDSEYWQLLADVTDDPPAFTSGINKNDTVITLSSADQFVVGDIVRIKDGISNDYWAEIAAIAGNVVALKGRSGELFDIVPGQSLISYGGAGRGGVLLDGQSPLIDVYTHDGEPWNGTDNHVRIGNLKGWGNVNHDAYGIAIGQPNGDYLVYSPQLGGLTQRGKAVFTTGSSGYSNFSDRPTSLSEINGTEGGKLSGIKDNADRTQTEIDGGIVTTGTLQAGSTGSVKAGITGDTNTESAVRLWAGATFANRTTAPFRVQQNGKMIATDAEVSGKITVGAGSNVAAGADVTGSNTAYDTARVDGEAAATVKSNATNALKNAATAQSTANDAASAALAAQGLLADIAADNKLTAQEKQATKKEWDIIVSEKTKNDTQADAFSVNKTAYGTAYGTLSTYITPLLANLAITSDIVGTTFRTNFKNYYDARTDILNAIAAKAKSLADTAQTQANLGVTNAATAQTTATNAATAASNAQGSATTANNLLADIAADNKLTASEKRATREEWNLIAAEKAGINSQSTTFGITTENTTYNNAFAALATYLNAGSAWASGVPSWLADGNLVTTTDIVGATFRTNWATYYTARTAILTAIAAKAKLLSSTAQSAAEAAAAEASAAKASAITANDDLAKIASDNWLTPVEKSAVRKEWDVIAAERTGITLQALTYINFSAGIGPAEYTYQSGNSYLLACLALLESILDISSSVSVSAPSDYASFLGFESEFYGLEYPIVYDMSQSVTPAAAGILLLNTDYGNSYYSLGHYLNNSHWTGWGGGVPNWIKDSNLATAWEINGATFRLKFAEYYDARTNLLGAISDAAAAHAGTTHAPRNADHTKTTIEGGLVTTGSLVVVQGGSVAAGVTGNTSGDQAVRFFAGSTFENRDSAKFRVLQNGKVFATEAEISGKVTSTEGNIGGVAINPMFITATQTYNYTGGDVSGYKYERTMHLYGTGGILNNGLKVVKNCKNASDVKQYEHYITISDGCLSYSKDIGSSPGAIQVHIGAGNTNEQPIYTSSAPVRIETPNVTNIAFYASSGIRVDGQCSAGSIFVNGNCSVGSFTDRTEMPSNISDALEIVNTMQPLNGKVDYSKLSSKAKKTRKITDKDGKNIKDEKGNDVEEHGRDLTITVSALIMVTQKLLAESEAQKAEIEALKKEIGENKK